MDTSKDIRVEAKPEYLFIGLGGTFSLEFAFRSIDIALEKCIEFGKDKVLYDFRNMAGKISVLDRYEVGKYAQKINPQVKYTAMIAREDQTLLGGLTGSFLENVLFNRGVRARIFTDMEQAVDWLTNVDSD